MASACGFGFDMELEKIARALVRDLSGLRFGPPVTHVYNPLIHAKRAYATYVRRYGAGTREVLMFGMNPGPWGMVQTGVPFGEVEHVRDWLGITARTDRPEREHPKRPVTGFECTRSEVSGRRVWGWAKATFGEPERFFDRFFICNYCPLSFMEEGGRNRTPDKLPRDERSPLFDACDKALRRTVEYFSPRFVIGVGAFAESRARVALVGYDVSIGRILHPSPASPLANRDWSGTVAKQLGEIGIGLST
jgi:single-strand selective monofunctional uracil DNA glycosylase